MSPVQFYALTVVSIIAILVCSNLFAKCRRLLQYTKFWLTKHLCRRHSILEMKWLGSWTWWSILMQSILIGANLLMTFFRFTDIQTAARRAGEVALVNMAVFYLGPHLSYQADCLHITLSRMKSIHRGITWSFVIMTTFHIAALKPTQQAFTSGLSKQFYGVIVCCSHFPLPRGRR